MNSNPSSRFVVYDDPLAPPHKCAGCGFANPGIDAPELQGRRQFLSWNFDAEFYGMVYLCTLCVNEISAASEYERVDELLGEMTTLADELEKVKSERDQYASSLVSLGASIRSMSDNGSLNISTGEPSEGAVKDGAGDSAEAAKPAVKQRPTNVSRPKLPDVQI
jgi:hypothetical protein